MKKGTVYDQTMSGVLKLGVLFRPRPFFFPRIRGAARFSLLDHDRLDDAGHAAFPEKNRPGAKRENLYR